MKTLLFIVLVASADLVLGNDNVAMESFQTSYKVYPDPQDFEEGDQTYQNYLFSGNGGGGVGGLHATPNLQFQSSVKMDSNLWQQNNVKTKDGVEGNANSPLALHTAGSTQIQHHQQQHQQQQHFNHRYRVPVGTPFVQHGKTSLSNQQVSGFSSAVEHGDNELSSSIEQNSGNIPRGTVYFKMYHGGKGEEQKTEYQTEILHETHPHHQSETGQKIFVHNYIPEEDSNEFVQHSDNYLVSKGHNKLPPFHSKTSGPPLRHQQGNHAVSYQSSNLVSLKDQKANDHHNFLHGHTDGTSQTTRGPSKYKAGLTASTGNVQSVQHGYQHEFQQRHPESNGHATLVGHNTRHSHPLYVVDSHAASVHHPPKVYENGGDHTKAFKTFKSLGRPSKEKHNLAKEELKLYIDGKTRSQNAQPGPNAVVLGKEQQTHHVTKVEEEFPAHAYHQLELNVKENNVVPSTISNTVLTQSLVPIKPEEYDSKYQKEVTWKNHFNQVETAADLPLVTKPADTFHFEINPYIDIGGGGGGSSQFDHQKALEGSTSFDIKHAIGNGNEEVHEGATKFIAPTKEIHTTIKHAGDELFGSFGKPTILYSTTPTYKVLEKTPSFSATAAAAAAAASGNDFHFDSLTSNSQIVHPAVEFNKFVRQPQTISVISEEHFKQQNAFPAANGFQQQMVKFHVPNEKDIFPSFKMKGGQFNKFKFQQYKGFKEANWDQHFQQQNINNHHHLHVHGRPSQKLFPVAHDDWHLRKVNTRTGKSNRIIIKEVMPLKTKSIIIKHKPSRINREAKWNPEKNRDDRQDQQQQKQFSVTASYKINRSMQNVADNDK